MTQERYWAKVERLGPDECWPWRLRLNGNGYAQFWLDGRYHPAAQVALEFSLGRPLLPGMQACHSCDNPPCMNPGHLFEGTPKDNSLDSKNKGRNWHPIGVLHPMAKLTVDQVREIRRSTDRQAALARRFGVSASNVAHIRARDTWRHVA